MLESGKDEMKTGKQPLPPNKKINPHKKCSFTPSWVIRTFDSFLQNSPTVNEALNHYWHLPCKFPNLSQQ